MEAEFIPYEQALALKELGFDEPCMCFQYDKDSIVRFVNMSDPKFNNILTYTIILNNPTLSWSDKEVLKPTFSQAFRWFREKYGLFYDILQYIDKDWKYTTYSDNVDDFSQSGFYNTYEEAELECLKKLIEIVKQK